MPMHGIINFITKRIDPRLFKFIAVGILNTLFGYSIYAFFVLLGFHYAIATLLSTVLGVLFNFKTIGNLVFKSNNTRIFYKFIMVYATIYLINVISLKMFTIMGLNLYIAGLVLIIPLALFSFALNRRFVFKEET